jgi:hypothetical protein
VYELRVLELICVPFESASSRGLAGAFAADAVQSKVLHVLDDIEVPRACAVAIAGVKVHGVGLTLVNPVVWFHC